MSLGTSQVRIPVRELTRSAAAQWIRCYDLLVVFQESLGIPSPVDGGQVSTREYSPSTTPTTSNSIQKNKRLNRCGSSGSSVVLLSTKGCFSDDGELFTEDELDVFCNLSVFELGSCITTKL